jgi:hypothetical protein
MEGPSLLRAAQERVHSQGHAPAVRSSELSWMQSAKDIQSLPFIQDWASVFLNRYSGSVESTTSRDFLDIKTWIEDDGAEPALIQEFGTRFRSIDLRKEVKRGTSVYNGIFNLLVIQGARDWMTGNVPQYSDLDDHHIIPVSKAATLGVGGLIHSILNRTPLTADTNRHVIGDRWPSE